MRRSELRTHPLSRAQYVQAGALSRGGGKEVCSGRTKGFVLCRRRQCFGHQVVCVETSHIEGPTVQHELQTQEASTNEAPIHPPGICGLESRIAYTFKEHNVA